MLFLIKLTYTKVLLPAHSDIPRPIRRICFCTNTGSAPAQPTSLEPAHYELLAWVLLIERTETSPSGFQKEAYHAEANSL